MSLLSIWDSNKRDIEGKHIQQLVKLAGNGKLKDDSDTAKELRGFLSEVSTNLLGQYLAECLESSFDDSGFVLQDIINELGQRLGCDVVNGLYRGKKGDIGYDGIWKFPDGYSIVVEVKTTDAYNIRLKTISDYRNNLIEDDKITGNSSILIIVGRKDTDSLEAQVRGSRHAWDMRLISAEKLFKLVQIKQSADSNTTIDKIRTVLTPLELTKVDFIVDLLATTTEDLQEDIDISDSVVSVDNKADKKFTPVSFNAEVAEAVGEYLGVSLKKQTRSFFVSSDKEISVRALVSKIHASGANKGYWYAFHPHFLEGMDNCKKNYIAYGCGSPEKIILFSMEEFSAGLDNLNITKKEDRMYWHVQFVETDTGMIRLVQKGGGEGIDVSSSLIN